MNVETTLAGAFASWLGDMEVVSHAAAPWHSATFSGTRHEFTLVTNNAANIIIFTHKIAETEIPIPGGFVADVAVSACPTGEAHHLHIDVLTISV